MFNPILEAFLEVRFGFVLLPAYSQNEILLVVIFEV